MTLSFRGGRFELLSRFEEKDVPKAAGFRWDPAAKLWWTSEPERAAKLAQHADASCRAQLERLASERTASLAASRAVDASIEVPCPAGRSYRPFQRAGIAFALARPSTLFGDEMGLGKTVQAAGVLNADSSIERAVVLCPASLKLNWQRELERWLARSARIVVASGSPPRLAWPAFFDALGGDPASIEILVLNYDILDRWRPMLATAEPFDCLIADEAHYLKNPKAKRTQLVIGHKPRKGKEGAEVAPLRARRRLFLTGTPVPAKPLELWPLLQFLDGDGLGRDFFGFAKRYCAAHKETIGRGRYAKEVWNFDGSSNLDELQERLRSRIMVRRLKREVLRELPPKRRQVIEIPRNGLGDLVASEDAAWSRGQEILASLQERVDAAAEAESAEGYAAAVAALREGERAFFAEISKLRHETALAKVPYVLEHARAVLEEEPKLVLFAHHRDVIAQLREGLAEFSPVSVQGGDAPEARQAAVDRFQGETGCRVFLGSLTAAGVGLTLTAAAHVLFAELDWTPAVVTQAEDRCHRIGQEGSLLVQHLVAEGSIDARMAELIVGKQATADAALDAQHPDRIAAAEKAVAEASAERAAAERAAELRAARKIAGSSIGGTPRRADLHAALRFLAALCDGAQALDGQGFNGTDTGWGRAVAAQSWALSERQAEVAAKLLRKYRRQLPADLYGRLYSEAAE